MQYSDEEEEPIQQDIEVDERQSLDAQSPRNHTFEIKLETTDKESSEGREEKSISQESKQNLSFEETNSQQ